MADTEPAIRNERVKLTANYLSGLAIGVFIVGSLAPIATVTYTDNDATFAAFALISVCIVVSGGLHWLGRSILGGLESDD